MQETTNTNSLRNGRAGSILFRDTLKNISKFFAWSGDEAYNDTDGVPKPVKCEFCGNILYYSAPIKRDNTIAWERGILDKCLCEKAIECREKEEAEEEARRAKEAKEQGVERHQNRIKEIIGDSGMSRRFLWRTFEKMQVTNSNRKAIETARQYADNFKEMLPYDKDGKNREPGRNGLLILGTPGTGKTHIAAAICNQLIENETAVICMTMIDLLQKIKNTFSGGSVSEENVLGVYKRVPLLVIDDIGKEPPTEWAISTIYNIINGRYESYMPTIITSNYDINSLIKRLTPRDSFDNMTAIATIDRLKEMCKAVTLVGESWRGR